MNKQPGQIISNIISSPDTGDIIPPGPHPINTLGDRQKELFNTAYASTVQCASDIGVFCSHVPEAIAFEKNGTPPTTDSSKLLIDAWEKAKALKVDMDTLKKLLG